MQEILEGCSARALPSGSAEGSNMREDGGANPLLGKINVLLFSSSGHGFALFHPLFPWASMVNGHRCLNGTGWGAPVRGLGQGLYEAS